MVANAGSDCQSREPSSSSESHNAGFESELLGLPLRYSEGTEKVCTDITIRNQNLVSVHLIQEHVLNFVPFMYTGVWQLQGVLLMKQWERLQVKS